MVIPWLLGLIGGEIGAKKKKFRGRGWRDLRADGDALAVGLRWTEAGAARAMAGKTRRSARLR